MHCPMTISYIFLGFYFIVSSLYQYFFTHSFHICCFCVFFYSSLVKEIGINFDSKFVVGFIRSVRTQTTSSACLKFFNMNFFSFSKNLLQDSFLYILLDNNTITLPNSGIYNKITLHLVDQRFLFLCL